MPLFMFKSRLALANDWQRDSIFSRGFMDSINRKPFAPYGGEVVFILFDNRVGSACGEVASVRLDSLSPNHQISYETPRGWVKLFG